MSSNGSVGTDTCLLTSPGAKVYFLDPREAPKYVNDKQKVAKIIYLGKRKDSNLVYVKP